MSTVMETEPPSTPPAPRSLKGLYAAGFLFLDVAVAIATNNVSSLRNAVIAGILATFLALTTYLYQFSGEPPSPSGRWSRLSTRRWPAVLFLIASAAILIATSLWALPDPPADGCPFPASGAGVTTAAPQGDSETHGLRFCPIRVNNGLPITGPFKVEGKIIGPKSLRQNLLLAVAIDPNTCSANGKPGLDATFPLPQVVLTTDDGSWSYVDNLGNDPEGVTLGRDFEVLSGTASDLTSLRDVPRTWKRMHGNAPGYSGVPTLPNGVRPLASFYVSGGQYKGNPVVCKAL